MTDPTVMRDLRRMNPAKIRLHAGEDEPRVINVADLGRTKWQRLARMLDTIAWQRIEALNARAELLGEITAELEDEPIAIERSRGDDVERLTGTFTAALARVHESAVKQRGTEIDRAMAALERIAGTLVDAMEVLRQSYEMALKLQAAALTASAADVSTEDAGMGNLLRVLGPLVMQQMAKPSASPPPPRKPAAPVNGHNHKPQESTT